MLGNVIDHRTDHSCPECDVVFEPSAYDNAKRADGTEYFSYDEATSRAGYFYAVDLLDTTVRDAVLHAETAWAFPVTLFIYDKGKRPLG